MSMTAPAAQTALSPRPYQNEAIQAVYDARNRGIRRVLINLPTGLGKTIVFTHLAKQMNCQTIIMAHRGELLEQARKKITMVWPSADIGLVKADVNETNHAVILASIQTISNPERLVQLPDPQLIIIDEAHHVPADSYIKALTYLRVYDPKGPLVVGVTATPDRADGESLDVIFEETVYEKDICWGIETGYLSDLIGSQVSMKLNLDTVKRTKKGDFQEKSLGAAMMEAEAPTCIFNAYTQHADALKTIIFTPTLELAEQVVGVFCRGGYKADMVSGETPQKTREHLYEDFASGKTPIIVNCGVLTEGFDEPSIECIIVARPTQSKSLYMQMIGRGSRKYPGKDNCLIIDIVGQGHSTGFTLSTLFGISTQELAEPGLLASIQKRTKTKTPDIIIPTAEKVTNAAILNLRWLQITPTQFLLSLPRGCVSLVYENEGWADPAWVVRRHLINGRKVQMGRFEDIGLAHGYAEDFVRRNGHLAAIARDTSWRGDSPTPRQTQCLMSMKIPFRPDITKGEASDLINYLINN